MRHRIRIYPILHDCRLAFIGNIQHDLTELLLVHLKLITSLGRSVLGLALLIIASTNVSAQSGVSNCGELRSQGQYGPYDYRTDKPSLGVVEQYHFVPSVEALIRGTTGGSVAGDLDYTLRAFPNHHRALLSMMRYGEKMKSLQPQGLRYPVECYFERAIRFRSDDILVRMIYATFLAKYERRTEATQQLEQATALADDNALSHHNIGLIYFDLKLFDKALIQAHKAVSLGLLQPALRDQLQGIGKWVEPPSALNQPTSDKTPSLESQ